MVKLTEEMISSRTRVSDMKHIKKLNCWGSELSDVSVLRMLTNVEVLSLSVNCLTSMADIQYCNNLQELYIRKNRIKDLKEILWLRDLSELKNLWLEENPCMTQYGDLYRMTVIKNLPQLQKLDNALITQDEKVEAIRKGIDLEDLEDRDEYNYLIDSDKRTSGYYAQDNESEEHIGTPSRRVSNQVIEYNDSNYSSFNNSRNSRGNMDESFPNERRISTESNYGEEYGRRYSHLTPSESFNGSHTIRSAPRSRCDELRRPSSNVDDRRSPYRSESESYYNGHERNHSPPNEMSYNVTYSHTNNESLSGSSSDLCSPSRETTLEPSIKNLIPNTNCTNASSLENSRSVVSQHYDDTYHVTGTQIDSAHQMLKCSNRRMSSSSPPSEKPYPRRPRNRNSNILSAVLCLIKELDSPSLEVAEMAVRCRMEELED